VEAQCSNEVKRYVLIVRRMKSYDDIMGPHDALRLAVGELENIGCRHMTEIWRKVNLYRQLRGVICQK
jgi:hypothetical protein